MSRVVVVSPHFDDAVLSCWSVLNRQGAEACVLTVFGGAPPPGRLWGWDALPPGAVDSATRVFERAEENRNALALTGTSHVDLDLPEVQYADVGGGRLVAGDLWPHLMDAQHVYAPAGAGAVVHPDHATVRDVVQGLRPDASLYADQPYCRFPKDLEIAGQRDGFRREVIKLSDADAQAKARAIACYAGEVLRLADLRDRLLNPGREFAYEVIWHRAQNGAE